MDQAWDGACGPRPSTARVQVRELSSQGLHNPQPRSKAPGHHGHSHSRQLAEECLSPARLVSAGLGSAGCQMPSAPWTPAPPPPHHPAPGPTRKSLSVQTRRAQARPFHGFAVRGAPGTLNQIEGPLSL